LVRDGGAVMRQKAASSATSTLVSPVLSVKKTRPPPERFTARRTGVGTGSGAARRAGSGRGRTSQGEGP